MIRLAFPRLRKCRFHPRRTRKNQLGFRLGITSPEDSVQLFNAKLTLSQYTTIGAPGKRVLNAVNQLLNKTKDKLASQTAFKISGNPVISDKDGKMLVGPFLPNASFAYMVKLTVNSNGAYSCDSKGNKSTIFKAGAPFYLMLPATCNKVPVGVLIQSSCCKVEYSAWQSGSTQPLVLAKASPGCSLALGVTVNKESGSVDVGDEPSAIILSKNEAAVIKGNTLTLSTVRYGKAANTNVIWSSSDNSVATVSSKGIITAVDCGDAVITADAAGAQAQCAVSVKEVPLGISLRIQSKKAIVDGKTVVIDENGSMPYISNGRTMLPLRFSSERMGANVKWTSNSEPVSISCGDTVVRIAAGNSNITVTRNGKTEKRTIDQSAQLKNGRIYVPVRAIAESLGFSVHYEEDGRIIIITKSKLSSEELSDRVKTAKSAI